MQTAIEKRARKHAISAIRSGANMNKLHFPEPRGLKLCIKVFTSIIKIGSEWVYGSKCGSHILTTAEKGSHIE